MYVVATTDPHGHPQCPICYTPMEREGEFCSPACWIEFHEIVNDMGVMVEMNYLTLEQQPWYDTHHG